jgi:EAL domain-containing protein (putative c-di-GMP-specific phosphodiesterase class I)
MPGGMGAQVHLFRRAARVSSTQRQITPSRSPAERIRLERDRHVAFAFAAADLLIETDFSGRIVAASGAAQAVLGVTLPDLAGQALAGFVAPGDRMLVGRLLKQVHTLGRIDPVAIHLARADGSGTRILFGACRLPNWDNSVFLSATLLPGTLADAAQPRDPSTGLLTTEALQAAAQRVSEEDAGSRELKLLRLEGLSGAMRQLPPERTAMLMQEIGGALRAVSIGGDAAGRLAEDMFGVVTNPGHHASSDAALVADLREAFRGAGLADGQIASRFARVDLSLQGLTGGEAGRALSYAISSFVTSMGHDFSIGSLHTGLAAAVDSTVARFADTRLVIAEHRFNLVFQPVVSLAGRSVHHFEALSRFPGSPNTFEMVRFMENVGLIAELDLAVCRFVVQALQANPGVRLAVNLSGRSLQNEAFRSALRALVDPLTSLRDRLLFELTESAKVEQLDEVAGFLGALRQQGHAICLDDFGAGAAAYGYLRRFDVDFVKIDGPFLKAAVDNPRERALIRSVCVLCSDIRCKIIGEMIEDESTAALAVSLGIGFGQGWLFGRPVAELPKPVLPQRRRGTVETWE